MSTLPCRLPYWPEIELALIAEEVARLPIFSGTQGFTLDINELVRQMVWDYSHTTILRD